MSEYPLGSRVGLILIHSTSKPSVLTVKSSKMVKGISSSKYTQTPRYSHSRIWSVFFQPSLGN